MFKIINETTDMRKKFLFILCLFTTLLILGCCFFPEINNSTFKHLYAANMEYDQVFVIDVKNNTIIDTLTGFGHVISITATKSGEKLYVGTGEGRNRPGAVYSVDLNTNSINKIIDRACDIYLSPDGTPFIIASTPYDSIRHIGIIDTVTDEITILDSFDILDTGFNNQLLAFDPNDKIFYTWLNTLQIFAYNYDEKRIIRNYTSATFPLLNFIISKDGNYLYFANGPVIDVRCDSIVGNITGNSATTLGKLALSPDGEKLYLTDPGKPFSLDVLASGEVKIFDTNTHTCTGSINVNNASGKNNTMTTEIVINQNGTKAYISGDYTDIFVVDLKSNKVIDVIQFDESIGWISPLALGI